MKLSTIQEADFTAAVGSEERCHRCIRVAVAVEPLDEYGHTRRPRVVCAVHWVDSLVAMVDAGIDVEALYTAPEEVA